MTRRQAAESRQAAYSRRQTAKRADIGEIPPIEDLDLLEACRFDLARFLRECFPHSTGMKPFGRAQIEAIDRLQRCILEGGRLNQSLPRGFVKTGISIRAALWALLYGHRRYVLVAGSSVKAAGQLIGAAKLELTTNQALLAMFPEVCWPFRCLEGKPQRCASQTCQGDQTYLRWTADLLVFPTIEDSPTSGTVLQVRPIANCRGLQYTTPAGEILRPDFFILDDPQTDAQAHSTREVDKLISLIRHVILRLAGHHTSLAGVVNCTVIAPGDVADRLHKDPSWQSCRYKMLESLPDALDTLWQDYARIRLNYDQADPAGQQRARVAALEFYKANRQDLDAGAVANWDWCYAWAEPEACEISAVQHALNIYIDDGRDVFMAECQNQPDAVDDGTVHLATPAEICARLNGMQRLDVPAYAQHVTAFFDVHVELLYYLVAAAGPGFRAAVIDYGTWPPQARTPARMRDARPTLQEHYGYAALEAALSAGLADLAEHVAGREYHREDGAALAVAQLLTDANWGQYTDLVYEWARTSKHRAVILPSHGKYLGARAGHWNDRKHETGELNGQHWRIPAVGASKRPWRHVYYDTNWWKSFTHERLRAPTKTAGSLELFGLDPARHAILAAHLLAEPCLPVTAAGRTVHEWLHPPDRSDNHWFDCLVGSLVAASIRGISLSEMPAPTHRRRRLDIKF